MGRKTSKKGSTQQHLQRLFFAVDLEPSIKIDLTSFQDRFSNSLYISELYPNHLNKKISPANFHITLSFLGNVSDKKLDMILDGFVDGLIQPSIKEFTCNTSHLVHLQPSNILALSIRDKNDSLMGLKKNIEKQINTITRLNLSKNSFIPHISLFRNVEVMPHSLGNIEFDIELLIRSFSLMVSRTSANGVSYETIAEWDLATVQSQRSVKEQLLGIDNL